jgi:hypothetical protein
LTLKDLRGLSEMALLADRHHAGLLYATQLLFEDRLGMPVFVPVGLDWWEEGYWRFGEVFGDDRLAQQYLRIDGHEWYDQGAGIFTAHDVEYPERLILGITLERFKALAVDDEYWKYTMSSVQENQHGYQRLAEEIGAAALYQVGNRGQQVDWGLDFRALVAAEAPIPPERGVLYHQEYDKDGVFQFQEPETSDRFKIASFVNCFDRMPEQWEYFLAAEAEATEFEFYVHGHDGRSGLIQPTTAVAESMAGYGWAWHDKPQGDGFGHIIHYWASIGRPLIGHASYYNGLFAGPFWEDGVTCVNLDNRAPHEAMNLVREISADVDRYEAMCSELRSRVDELVDFNAEEAAIRNLLGIPPL